jgi:hypothetical protein
MGPTLSSNDVGGKAEVVAGDRNTPIFANQCVTALLPACCCHLLPSIA